MAASVLVGWLLPGCGPTPPAAPPAAPKTGATNAAKPTANAATSAPPVTVGAFTDDPHNGGRDPFFPRSVRRAPPPPPTASGLGPGPAKAPVITAASLVLHAILRTPTSRLATINRTTLAEGEEGEVKLPGGKARIKCLEIGADSVVVLVDGVRRVLSFREGNP